MSADSSMHAPVADAVESEKRPKGWQRSPWTKIPFHILWPRFPVAILVADKRLQFWVPKLIWLVIPMEYYVITSFSGGFDTESYLSVVIFSVVCVFAFLITGFVAAVLLPFEGTLHARSRGMVTSLLCVWGTVLLLQFASYFLTFSTQHEARDLLASLLHDRWPVPNPHGIDRESVLPNFLAYFGYALLAAIIDLILIRMIARPDPSLVRSGREAEWICEPSLITVSALVALLMLLLHSLTIAQFTGLLNSAHAS